MRTAALTLLAFVAFGYALKAQKFTLLPQVGFENSKTSVQYNNLSTFSPEGVVFTPQVGMQLAYRSKPGHGFFVGAASSRNIVPFRFTDPETGMNTYSSHSGKMQVRLEGGYQFSSKPLFFKKKTITPASSISRSNSSNTNTLKKSCGTYSYKARCQKSNTADKQPSIARAKQQGSWVRLQPSIGMGYIPSVKSDVISRSMGGQSEVEYRAGNWQTAVQAGMAFELGKNQARYLTVGVNYLKGLGDNAQSFTTVNGTKTVTTHLQSSVSAWNLRVGVPLSLGPKKQAVKQQAQKSQPAKTGCRQYRIMYRCNKTI